MNILGGQILKLKSFFLILFFLYMLNVIFNMKFDWAGVSVIVRVYIFVLSFYLVFLFSNLNTPELKKKYMSVHGKRGIFYLFFQSRVLLFILIYSMTWLFTFTNYTNINNWPALPFFRLLDGQFSNTLFYCLLLLFIIKQNRRPRLAIPLFIIYSILFFITDKSLYRFLDNGYGVGAIKFFKYFLFSFFLLMEFSDKWKNFIKYLLGSFVFAIAAFYSVILLGLSVYHFSDKESYNHNMSAMLLLKSGCSSPMDEVSVLVKNVPEDEKLRTIIDYTDVYNGKINLTQQEWESVLKKEHSAEIEAVFRYFIKNGVDFDFGRLVLLIQGLSSRLDENYLFGMTHLRHYFSMKTDGNWPAFINLYESGNSNLKKWMLLSLENSKSGDAAYFLLKKISDKDRNISEIAYSSLSKITGLNPVHEFTSAVNDIRVLFYFRNALKKIYPR